jgi:hypothetical protein
LKRADDQHAGLHFGDFPGHCAGASLKLVWRAPGPH